MWRLKRRGLKGSGLGGVGRGRELTGAWSMDTGLRKGIFVGHSGGDVTYSMERAFQTLDQL